MNSNIIKDKKNSTFLGAIWMLLWIVGCSSSQCSYQCINTEQKCQVCFEKCNQTNSKNDRFYNCSQLKQNHENSTTTTVYSLKQCSQHCCSLSLSSFQIYNLLECLDNRQQFQQNITTIIIALVVGIFLVIICIICGHPTLRQKLSKCLCENLARNQNEESQSIIIQDRSCIVGNEENEVNRLQDEILKQLLITICSICLQNGCDVLSNCGHSYHFKCFWKWYNLRKSCSVCSIEDVKIMRYYCLLCQKRIIRKSIILLKLSSKQFRNLLDLQCQNCREK